MSFIAYKYISVVSVTFIIHSLRGGGLEEKLKLETNQNKSTSVKNIDEKMAGFSFGSATTTTTAAAAGSTGFGSAFGAAPSAGGTSAFGAAPAARTTTGFGGVAASTGFGATPAVGGTSAFGSATGGAFGGTTAFNTNTQVYRTDIICRDRKKLIF